MYLSFPALTQHVSSAHSSAPHNPHPSAAPTPALPHTTPSQPIPHPPPTPTPLHLQLLWSVGPSAFLLASLIMTTTLYHLDKFDHQTMASMGHEVRERTASRELAAASQVGAGWELAGGSAWCCHCGV